METPIYTQEGKKAGTFTLPESIFGLKWNADLVHQVVVSEESSRRTPIAHTKTRGEVRGGGKKPWQQKGTGRARHGSTRSPIWVGGGVAHGPRNDKNFNRKVNKKMKAKALYTILAKKHRDGEVILVDSFTFEPKTKFAKTFLDTMKIKKAYIATSSKEMAARRAFSNINTIEVSDVRNLHPVDILRYKYLIITNPADAMKTLEAKLN